LQINYHEKMIAELENGLSLVRTGLSFPKFLRRSMCDDLETARRLLIVATTCIGLLYPAITRLLNTGRVA